MLQSAGPSPPWNDASACPKTRTEEDRRPRDCGSLDNLLVPYPASSSSLIAASLVSAVEGLLVLILTGVFSSMSWTEGRTAETGWTVRDELETFLESSSSSRKADTSPFKRLVQQST